MILATTIAPVALSLLIVAPLRMISEWEDEEQTEEQRQRGQVMDSENNMLTRQASYLETKPFSGEALCITQSAGKGYPNQHYFQQMLWMWTQSNGKSILCSWLQSAHTGV